MSTGAGGEAPPPGVDPSGLGPELQTPFVERYGLAQRAEGILAPLLTTVLAFLVGGLVVIVTTGKNPTAGAAFVAYVLSPAGQQVLQDAGFQQP